jgi:hypothetical protein
MFCHKLVLTFDFIRFLLVGYTPCGGYPSKMLFNIYRQNE